MITEFSQFIFDNYKDENLHQMAIDKMMEFLPDDEKKEDFAERLLNVIEEEQVYLPNDIMINCLLHLVVKDNELVSLTPTETRLLEILATNKGNVVNYSTLIAKLWNYGENSIIKTNICNLRKKLDLPIESVKGIGYIIR